MWPCNFVRRNVPASGRRLSVSAGKVWIEMDGVFEHLHSRLKVSRRVKADVTLRPAPSHFATLCSETASK
jgi:hypothetical protein